MDKCRLSNLCYISVKQISCQKDYSYRSVLAGVMREMAAEGTISTAHDTMMTPMLRSARYHQLNSTGT